MARLDQLPVFVMPDTALEAHRITQLECTFYGTAKPGDMYARLSSLEVDVSGDINGGSIADRLASLEAERESFS